MTTHLN